MPKYCRLDKKTFKVTNQDAILYPAPDGKGCLLKLPNMTENRIPLSYLKDTADLRKVVFKPYYGKYIMTFVIEDAAPPCYPDMPNMAGVDLGTDNIAQTVRLLYTKAVRSCQLTSSLPNKRRPQSPSSPEEKLIVMQRLHS